MIALELVEQKKFMSDLLIKEVFDHFLMVEAELFMGTRHVIEGKLQADFFSEEERFAQQGRTYAYWKEMKSLLFLLMKGQKTPLSFRIVLMLSKENMVRLLERVSSPLQLEEIGGFFLHLNFEKKVLRCITGTNLHVFTLDKLLDQEWDNNVKTFLRKKGISFVEE